MERNTANRSESKKKERTPQEGDVEVATGAFIIRDGKIFLATGSKFHGEWVVPGGHINFGESSKDCIERE
ncbi:MAG: NUDIX domain-containing protein, partial [Candidatus Micrarchaeota archaeon]